MARSFGIELESLAEGFGGRYQTFTSMVRMIGESVEPYDQICITPHGNYGHQVNAGEWKVVTDVSLGGDGVGNEIVSPPLSGSIGEKAVRSVCRSIRRLNSGRDERSIIINSTCGHHVHHEVLESTFFPSFTRGTPVANCVKRSKRAARILGNAILGQTLWVNCWDRLLAPSRRVGGKSGRWANPWQSDEGRRMPTDQDPTNMQPIGISPKEIREWNFELYGGSFDKVGWENRMEYIHSDEHWGAQLMKSVCRQLNAEGEVWDGNTVGRYPFSRYTRINMANSWQNYGTWEFRQHQGTLNAEKILQWMRITQKFITVCYAPEHAAKWAMIEAGNYNLDSMEDFFAFLGIKQGAKRFWAKRAFQLNRGDRPTRSWGRDWEIEAAKYDAKVAPYTVMNEENLSYLISLM